MTSTGNADGCERSEPPQDHNTQVREAIARIIDDWAFTYPDPGGNYAHCRQTALTKADAILALDRVI